MPIFEEKQSHSHVMSVAQYLCATLEANGIDTVFGIPGVHNVELYRGLASCDIRHVTPRNEQGAGFMADGYARACGRVAACFVITGPGLTNMATAMGQALADSVPMLVISSVNPVGAMGSGQGFLHEMPDQRSFAEQVSVFSQTVLDVEELPMVLARAFAVFYCSRPGPVHIEIPVNFFSQIMPESVVDGEKFVLPSRVAASLEDMKQVADWLIDAQNPLIIAGGGAVAAFEEVRLLADSINAPVIMSSNGRGILPANHPLALACSPALKPIRALIEQADFVLALGAQIGSSEYYFNNHNALQFNGKLVRIDIDAQQLMRTPRGDLAILSDCDQALKLLRSILPPSIHTSHASNDVREIKAQIKDDTSLIYQAGQMMLACVAETLPESIIVGDSTQPVYAGMMHFAPDKPRSWFCSATGFGTLGYAVSAATGAWLARQVPVVAVIGDGGLMFNLGEILTARQIDCPLIILLWNNKGYYEIKHYMEEQQIEPIGVDLLTPNFEQLAQSFDCAYEKITVYQGLKNALMAAAARNRPTIIEVDEQKFLHSFGDNYSRLKL